MQPDCHLALEGKPCFLRSDQRTVNTVLNYSGYNQKRVIVLHTKLKATMLDKEYSTVRGNVRTSCYYVIVVEIISGS
jgi:hypothetical protein